MRAVNDRALRMLPPPMIGADESDAVPADRCVHYTVELCRNRWRTQQCNTKPHCTVLCRDFSSLRSDGSVPSAAATLTHTDVRLSAESSHKATVAGPWAISGWDAAVPTNRIGTLPVGHARTHAHALLSMSLASRTLRTARMAWHGMAWHGMA